MRGLGLGLRLGRGRGISVSVGAINPVFVSDSFTTGSAGNPAALTATFTYAGADTLEMVGVTSTSGTAPSKANIEAGTGTGSLEEFVKSFTSGADTPITGLTSTSETATHIHYFIREVNNGGESAVQTEAVSGLDFTPSVVSAAVTNVAGTEITLTMSAATWHDAIDTADWALTGAGANSRTITGISGSGTTSIVLTVSGAVAAGALSLAHTNSDSNLRDASGNLVADFSGQSVTNNLASWNPTLHNTPSRVAPVGTTATFSSAPVTSNSIIFIATSGNPSDISDITVGGTSIDGDRLNVITNAGFVRVEAWPYTGTAGNSDIVVTFSDTDADRADLYVIDCGAAVNVVAAASNATAAGGSATFTAVAGDSVISCMIRQGGTATTYSSGTEVGVLGDGTGDESACAIDNNLSAGSFSHTTSNTGASRAVILGFQIREL